MSSEPDEKAESVVALPPSLLGEALVKEGALTQEQLDRSLRIQECLEQRKPLGEVLIELRYVTKQAITKAIGEHGATMRIGDILFEQGHITGDDLENALRLQKSRGLKIGEALIELGAINERTLLKNLARQAGVPYIEPVFSMVDESLFNSVSPDYLDRYGFVPFSKGTDGKITVVVRGLKDPDCLSAVQDLYRDNVELALGPVEDIHQVVEEFRRFRQEDRDARKAGTGAAVDDSVVKLIDHIIATAINERASDIHIEPMYGNIRLRYRIDGVLVHKTDLPKDLLPRIVSRLKILAECNITEHQHHQGGRILYKSKGRDFDLRLSVYVTVHGECSVLRILNKQMGLVELEELGMTPSMLERYREEVLNAASGVVLITGPTGSGKTTTLYSSLNYCNSTEIKIITAEDPVEYTIDGIIQCSIYEKIGRTFEATLREIVRQDPDIIVLGEIRDRISAETAIQAALTGHKVYSTFHTEDTIGGLLRLIDMEIETFLISSTVISVLAQRLLRRICSHCAGPYVPTPLEIRRIGLRIQDVHDFEFKKGLGCKHCNYTGYSGRWGIYELLILNEEVKEAILQKRPAHVVREISTRSTGLVSMREDGIAKVIRGQTTFSEVLRYTPGVTEMRPLKQIMAITQ